MRIRDFWSERIANVLIQPRFESGLSYAIRIQMPMRGWNQSPQFQHLGQVSNFKPKNSRKLAMTGCAIHSLLMHLDTSDQSDWIGNFKARNNWSLKHPVTTTINRNVSLWVSWKHNDSNNSVSYRLKYTYLTPFCIWVWVLVLNNPVIDPAYLSN